MPDLAAIVARVRQTAPGLDPDAWMAAAAPQADTEQKAALRARLAAVAPTNMVRDAARIRALQASLRTLGLKGFLVPRADEHMGEYLLPGNERLHWLTGFSGSAGLAVVLEDEAALFMDGRYTLQGPAEVDAAVIACRHFQQPPPDVWLAEKVTAGDVIGYDPRTLCVKDAESWRKALEAKGAGLRSLAQNPIDALWRDRPGDPFSAIIRHADALAGATSEEKRRRVAAVLAAADVEAVVLNQLDSIAWLLNIRGGDTPNTPLVQSFAVLGRDGHATWCVDEQKFTPGLRESLGKGVTVAPLTAFAPALTALAGKRVMLDPQTAPAAIAQTLEAAGAHLHAAADPCIALKAQKNAAEKNGTRAAHIRDGAAMVRFLCWFDQAAAEGNLDELGARARLEESRRADPLYRGMSFETIAAAGPNAALPHYRSTAASNRRIAADSLFLIDSGGQYVDGTTDITRTIAVGNPPDDQKRHFTLVLKGHIALSTALFPQGTVGKQLDALARQFLWREGLDYDHGTGHGVGSYLGVHETAARIAKASAAELKDGMLLSNEPGFYKEGSHGIRIENLLFVTPSRHEGFLAFEDVTLCPIDTRAIDTGLLTQAEVAWLDAYHARVWAIIAPLVEGETRQWLQQATAKIGDLPK